MEPFARYLVAVDTSPSAEIAAQLAIGLARGRGAELLFCHAINVHQMLVYADRTFDDFPLALAAARESARSTLDRCCTLASNAGVFARSYVREGKPAEEVVELAAVFGADVMVIGGGNSEKIHRVLNGSTRDEILRTARLPVLVVPSAPAKAEIGPHSIVALADGSQAAAVAATIARACASRLALVPAGYDGWQLAIDRAVHEHRPDLIVTGAGRRPSWRAPFPANPVERALHDARVPVLVIAEPPAG